MNKTLWSSRTKIKECPKNMDYNLGYFGHNTPVIVNKTIKILLV